MRARPCPAPTDRALLREAKMDTRDIRVMHQVDEGIIGDPYLLRQKAIAMLQRAHGHRGWLLDECDRISAEVERLRIVQAQRDDQNEYIRRLQRERDEAVARAEELESRLISVAEIV